MALKDGTYIEPSSRAPSSDTGTVIGHPVGVGAGSEEEALAMAEAHVGLANEPGGLSEIDGTYIETDGGGGSG